MPAVSQPAAIPAAAASAVAELIDAPPGWGTVIGAGPRAAVFRMTSDAGPRCVSLLGPGSAGLPNGVRLERAESAFRTLTVGAAIQVGGDRIRLGDLAIRVVRRWDSRVRPVRIRDDAPAVLAGAVAAAELGVPRAALAPLDAGVDDPARAVDVLADALGRLVGLGRGLTPGGDDVLAGIFVGLHATGRADLIGAPVQRALPGLDERTTALSADLLRLAARGHACTEVLHVLRCMHAATSAGDPTRRALRSAVDGLLSVGHTSGADLATGLLLGLRLASGSNASGCG